jgi:hypothetical protein
MGKHIKNFINGIGQALVLVPEAEYEIPSRGEFSKDHEALRGDFRKVGRDMTVTVKKNRDYHLAISENR